MALRVNPHMPINIDMPSKNLIPNFFWFFFCPYVTFNFYALPIVHINENETPEEFAHRVQELTAEKLHLKCTTYSYKDKVCKERESGESLLFLVIIYIYIFKYYILHIFIIINCFN